jgi:RNA polymerase sigma factor (sigma-70 family)
MEHVAFLRKSKGGKWLNHAQELDLIAAYRRGDHAARDKVIENNRRIAYRLADRYARGYLADHRDDLRNESIIGLMVALERYDVTRPNRFSTYATSWIRHQLQEYMCRVQPAMSIRRSGQTYAVFAEVARGETDPEVIARKARASLDVTKATMAARVGVARTYLFESGEEWLKSPEEGPDEDARRRMLAKTLDRVMRRHLTKRERDILMRLLLGEEETLQDIGASYGLSRERIRQVKEEAFGKLRRALTAQGVAP